MSASRFATAPYAYAGEVWYLLTEAFSRWLQDSGLRMAAALAFYMAFSLGPALLVGLGIAGLFVEQSAAKAELAGRLELVVTPQAAEYVLSVVDALLQDLQGRHIPVIGLVSALVTASAVFAELQSSLNTIWKVVPSGGNRILWTLYSRAVSFGLVVGLGILLLLSVVANTVISGINALFAGKLAFYEEIVQQLAFIRNVALIPAVLALIYRFVPDTEIAWKDVWFGTMVTTLMLFLGKSVFSMYLRFSILSTVYGAAGSLVILLAWLYYSAQVFLYGAELTKVYAERLGSRRSFQEPGTTNDSR
jgi:membrane protein